MTEQREHTFLLKQFTKNDHYTLEIEEEIIPEVRRTFKLQLKNKNTNINEKIFEVEKDEILEILLREEIKKEIITYPKNNYHEELIKYKAKVDLKKHSEILKWIQDLQIEKSSGLRIPYNIIKDSEQIGVCLLKEHGAHHATLEIIITKKKRDYKFNNKLLRKPIRITKKITLKQEGKIKNMNRKSYKINIGTIRQETYTLNEESTFKDLIIRIFEEPTIHEKTQPDGKNISIDLYQEARGTHHMTIKGTRDVHTELIPEDYEKIKKIKEEYKLKEKGISRKEGPNYHKIIIPSKFKNCNEQYPWEEQILQIITKATLKKEMADHIECEINNPILDLLTETEKDVEIEQLRILQEWGQPEYQKTESEITEEVRDEVNKEIEELEYGIQQLQERVKQLKLDNKRQ
ncbi:MAG TPA: hypothetical protein VIY08_02915 [Candidatus Nitrosocosmicus sp.]